MHFLCITENANHPSHFPKIRLHIFICSVLFVATLLSYVVLSVTSHINCIVARCLINVVYLTACCLYQVMMTLHFLNDVANDAESTQKSKITS